MKYWDYFWIKQTNLVVTFTPVSNSFIPKNPFKNVDLPAEIEPIMGMNNFMYILKNFAFINTNKNS